MEQRNDLFLDDSWLPTQKSELRSEVLMDFRSDVVHELQNFLNHLKTNALVIVPKF